MKSAHTGWAWFSRLTDALTVWSLTGSVGAGLFIGIWARLQRRPGPDAVVLSLITFVLALMAIAVTRHLLHTEKSGTPETVYATGSLPGTASEQFIIDTLKEAQAENRQFSEENRATKEQLGHLEKRAINLQQSLEAKELSLKDTVERMNRLGERWNKLYDDAIKLFNEANQKASLAHSTIMGLHDILADRKVFNTLLTVGKTRTDEEKVADALAVLSLYYDSRKSDEADKTNRFLEALSRADSEVPWITLVGETIRKTRLESEKD